MWDIMYYYQLISEEKERGRGALFLDPGPFHEHLNDLGMIESP